jgi:hypothetical protein
MIAKYVSNQEHLFKKKKEEHYRKYSSRPVFPVYFTYFSELVTFYHTDIPFILFKALEQ